MLWKTLFVSSVFVLWCFVCQQWYVCGIKQSCKNVEATAQSPSTTTAHKKVIHPILFQWSNDKAIINETFPNLKDSILKEMGTQKKLKITGFYFENEGEELGLKRAQAVKKLFLDTITTDRIIIESKVLQEVEGVRDNLFESVAFEMLETSEPAGLKEVIIETEEGALVYFPFNSTEKEVDIRVDAYLQQIAVRLQNSDEKIHITGHTDNVGDAKANYDIGRQRAKAIREILIERGVSRGRITIYSKGETEPLASNETETGRQENRRTEIRIFK